MARTEVVHACWHFGSTKNGAVLFTVLPLPQPLPVGFVALACLLARTEKERARKQRRLAPAARPAGRRTDTVPVGPSTQSSVARAHHVRSADAKQQRSGGCVGLARAHAPQNPLRALRSVRGRAALVLFWRRRCLLPVSLASSAANDMAGNCCLQLQAGVVPTPWDPTTCRSRSSFPGRRPLLSR